MKQARQKLVLKEAKKMTKKNKEQMNGQKYMDKNRENDEQWWAIKGKKRKGKKSRKKGEKSKKIELLYNITVRLT